LSGSAAALEVVAHVDGGARGNPGPAGIGVVLSDSAGSRLAAANEFIGEATNNVAEYRAVLLGIELAASAGASVLELVNDSQLVARQLTGDYKVRHEGLKSLHGEAISALKQFDRWSVRSVPRADNELADQLVNDAIDARGPTVGPATNRK
jgi:ribonuclease HI